ncbi:MAG: glycosyltransferase family 9 protein [Pseudonocardiaceae bacterium]
MAVSPPTVLVLRALGLGDLLTAVPALRGMRSGCPDHRVLLAAPAPLRELALLTGAVDDLVPTARLGPIPWPGQPAVAVNLHGRGPQSTHALCALRPATVLAHAHPGVQGPHWVPDLHEVHRWCRLLQYFGIQADPADLELDHPPVSSPVPGAVVVHPGCGSVARNWPTERYAAVARRLTAERLQVVVTGNAAQYPLASQVAAAAGLPDHAVLAGRTTLTQLATVVAQAALVVCGDTGVAHLATAYRTPSVVLFGPVPPQHWGPPSQRPQHIALWTGTIGNTFAHRPDPSLLRIPTAAVIAAAVGLLDRYPVTELPGPPSPGLCQ